MAQLDFDVRLCRLRQSLTDIERRLTALEANCNGKSRLMHLASRQQTVLHRIKPLEGHKAGDEDGAVRSDTEARLRGELDTYRIYSSCFKRVPDNYYTQDLEYRRNCLQAASIQHLCKSLLFENPRLPAEHASQEFRYYLVIVQYDAKLHGEKVKRFLQKADGKLGKQYFRPRQARPEVSEELSGYESGSVTPVGLKTQLPLILSHKIDQLQPDFFWMGGGEQLLKLGMSVTDFKRAYTPHVVDCTY